MSLYSGIPGNPLSAVTRAPGLRCPELRARTPRLGAVHSGMQLGSLGLSTQKSTGLGPGDHVCWTFADVAAVLLDVIMETDVAGLDLVEYIRNELKNETVRIILRTGQPGQAPERRVIVDYDINDYKAKTELTADKLFTTLTAALRGFQQLQRARLGALRDRLGEGRGLIGRGCLGRTCLRRRGLGPRPHREQAQGDDLASPQLRRRLCRARRPAGAGWAAAGRGVGPGEGAGGDAGDRCGVASSRTAGRSRCATP